jgi:hypothetical protein
LEAKSLLLPFHSLALCLVNLGALLLKLEVKAQCLLTLFFQRRLQVCGLAGLFLQSKLQALGLSALLLYQCLEVYRLLTPVF